MKIDLSTCSKNFIEGINWLVNELKYDKTRIKSQIKELKEEKIKSKSGDLAGISNNMFISNLNSRLKLKFLCSDVKSFYILNKINSNLVKKFLNVAQTSKFWVAEDTIDWIFDDPHHLWFFKELGLGNIPEYRYNIEEMIRNQTIEGYLNCNSNDHTGPMRVLVAERKGSKVLDNAIKYWLENWKDFTYNIGALSIGILALTELNINKYVREIQEETSFLKKLQNPNGSWSGQIAKTSYAIWAISKVNGIEDSSAVKGFNWLKTEQEKNGSWNNTLHQTSWGLLGLLAMGDGPKMPIELAALNIQKLEQKFRYQKPIFIHTSPLYKGMNSIKEINDKIVEMFSRAKHEIRIASLYIDMFYDEIINIIKKNPDLLVKIITKAGKIEGKRKKIAQNAIEQLNIVTKGNVIKSKLNHSRMIIIDDTDVLVSSADLTRDQLIDEFNAGIWTSDEEFVRKAIEYFENIINIEKGS